MIALDCLIALVTRVVPRGAGDPARTGNSADVVGDLYLGGEKMAASEWEKRKLLETMASI